jgi:hypothetical protein
MTKRHHKASDGKYHIHGHRYERIVGSRAEVMHGTAYHTAGGLKKHALKYNKHGKIVSRAKSARGPALLKRLTNAGYFTRKGKFGYVKKSAKASGHRRHRRTKKHRRRRHRTHHRRPRRHRRRRRAVTLHEFRGPRGRFVRN